MEMVRTFAELTPEQQASAGGKGGMLAKLYQKGYPVPDGLVVLPSAFQNGELDPQAWSQVQARLHTLRQDQQGEPSSESGGASGVRFAVRSSALNEDSAKASFAGAFETVLNVGGDQEIRDAIHQVWRSAQAERVKRYSATQGLEPSDEMAVVIQRMVPADLAGVIFTADPVTGSYANMIGNYVHGLGEQLVSGEANAQTFHLSRPKGRYDGPDGLKPYAARLYKMAERLERELGQPQDIEWAVAGGKLYLLQARPITTLNAGDLDTYAINETLVEDTLWVNTNVAEAVPDVFSPLTWTVVRKFDEELNYIPGFYVWSGNIYGRVYSNIGLRVSAAVALTGWDTQRVLGLLGDMFGQVPDDLVVPIHPYSRTTVIKEFLPRLVQIFRKMLVARVNLQRFVRDTPRWCQEMTDRIEQVKTPDGLLALWRFELQPYAVRAWWGHSAGASGVLNVMAMERKLTKLVGKEDANLLLSNLRGDAGLASLGPLVGIARVIKGEMSREAYLQQYGHRGPHELELAIPHPAEDIQWLDKQIEAFHQAPVDVEHLLHEQQAQHEAAKQRFLERYPRRRRWLERQLARAAAGAQRREAARSEFTRVFRVIRAFALRAGALTGIGDDVFMLYLDEVLDLLAGRDDMLRHVPARRKNYELYQTLPPFPSIIRGRFDAFQWLDDPNRRSDYYDATRPAAPTDSDTLTGIAGAAGRVEGRVRVLMTPEEGDLLQPGEILVAPTTNVGWTPLFPKAAAIITDIGAPLSHAAIVARELGIPAVVGSGSATTRLKTGDRVIVDGGQGTVQILD